MKVRSLGLLIVILLVSGVSNLFIEASTSVSEVMNTPSWNHLMGTDSLGRDVLLRLVQAVGVSIVIGGLSLVVSLAIGFLVGGIAGWKGGWWDLIFMRIVDLFDSLPDLLIALILLLLIGEVSSTVPSLLVLAVVLGISGWPRMGRQVRALILQEKEKGYAFSAQSLGVGPLKIIFKHLLPNLRQPLMRFSLMHVPAFILYEGSLSFFGLGVKSPTPSLGLMLQEGWRSLSLAPHLVWAPAVTLFLILVLFESLARPLRS